MNDLYTALLPYLASLMGVTCVQPMQNVKTPALPYATVEIRSMVPTGSFFTGRDDSENTESLQRTYSFTVDVNVYGRNNKRGEDMDILHALQDGLEDHTRRRLALGHIMAFQEIIQPPADISGLIGDQYQPRANIAMRWHTSRAVTYDIDMIDTAEITPTITGDA